MNWNSYLQDRTRDPRFLWRAVLAVLAVGGMTAVVVHVSLDMPLKQAELERIMRADQPPPAAPESTARAQFQEAVEAHDWWRVWWLVPVISWVEIDLGAAAIAALTGLFWLGFLLQAGHALSPRGARFWLCLAAVGLGALSTWPTLFAVVWQEEMWNLTWDGEGGLVAGLRYFIAGVGLREELIKLVFFLPLAPFVVARRNELERLIVASCVGLGFAAQENIIYFAPSASTASVSRYLTANFWHLASTGLAGLWLCRAIRWPRECGPQFLAYFGLIALGHGLYNAFIAVPELLDYALFTTIVFIGLAYFFFHELREVRPVRRETVSLTANFVLGLSLLASVTFVYVTAQWGLTGAAELFLGPAVAAALMAYVFLREMPESLVRT